jgi:predicted permease
MTAGGDVRFALRQLRRSPGFAAVVVLTMALGIGLNTAVFSGVHALLLRPPSGVREPERLVRVYRTFPGVEYGPNSIPHYLDLAERGGNVFDGVAAWTPVTAALATGAEGEIAEGQVVSANYFDVLGAGATIGRTFTTEEAVGIGGHPVLVLSHSAWRERFAADPGVVGRTVRVNGVAFEVVGVAPEGFRGALDLYAPEFWAPLAMQPVFQPGREDRWENRSSNFLAVVARKKTGASLEQTRAGTEALLAGLRRDYPDAYEERGIALLPHAAAGIAPDLRAGQVRVSVLLLTVVGLLHLIACFNVANLFLVRAEHREREMGTRVALGARRREIVRQLVAEAVLFVVLAGAAGIALAAVGVRLLEGVPLPAAGPIDLDVELSGPVLLVTLTTALGSGLLFGLAPALWVLRADPGRAVKASGGRAASGSGRLGGALAVAQVAFSVVLLLGAGTFLRNLREAAAIDPGFDAARLLNVDVSPELVGYDATAQQELYRELVERLDALPGVAGVSWADVVPLGLTMQSSGTSVPGSPLAEVAVGFARVGPDYFETMGIAVRGRGITAADDASASEVVVVNETMAERYWPGQDAIGRIIETQARSWAVVGVAADGKYESIRGPATPFLYLPIAQDFRAGATLHVHTAGDPATLAPIVRATVRTLNPAVPVETSTMKAHLGVSLLPARIAAGALGLFSAIGLVLSALGIYGIIAYGVARRTREIGIRVALGADGARVLRGVIGRALRLTFLGLALGVGLSLVAAAPIRTLLLSVRVVEPVTFVAVAALMTLVAVLAAVVPARRALRVDPVGALRSE